MNISKVAVQRIEHRIAAQYGGLSQRLQSAADYVLANPVDVATRSLRSISSSSNLAPATFTRLAQALGFEGYEEMRELSRLAIGERYSAFSEKAERLQRDESGAGHQPFLARHARAVIGNIESMVQDLDPERLDRIVTDIGAARHVYLMGGLSSAGLTDHLAYLSGFFAGNWTVVGAGCASPAPVLSGIGPGDVLVVLTLRPFATRSIRTMQRARAEGAETILLTDSHTCPAIAAASQYLILPTESPQFFSSNAAILVLLEAIVGMLVARAGPDAQERIAAVTNMNHDLEEYWPGS